MRLLVYSHRASHLIYRPFLVLLLLLLMLMLLLLNSSVS